MHLCVIMDSSKKNKTKKSHSLLFNCAFIHLNGNLKNSFQCFYKIISMTCQNHKHDF